MEIILFLRIFVVRFLISEENRKIFPIIKCAIIDTLILLIFKQSLRFCAKSVSGFSVVNFMPINLSLGILLSDFSVSRKIGESCRLLDAPSLTQIFRNFQVKLLVLIQKLVGTFSLQILW